MTKHILRVDGSMRKSGSRSRKLTDVLIDQLKTVHSRATVTTRDLAGGVPFVDDAWIAANFTDPCARSPEQRAVLAQSDALLNEVKDADILVLGTPIYNFGVPAAVKAWIDMIARARESFRYTDQGPEGLLTGKTAYFVLVSGGTKAGSKIDFAWPYLKHVLGFIGITDVHLIASDLIGVEAADADADAIEAIKAATDEKQPS